MRHYLFLLLLLFAFSSEAQKVSKKKAPVTKDVKKSKKQKSKTEKITKQSIAKEMAEHKKKQQQAIKSIPIVRQNPIIKNGKVLTGNISSVQGFRICIYNGQNREESFTIKRKYMLEEQNMKSYMSYTRPYYRIKVGDFETKKLAQKALKKIQVTYPNAFIVPDIITIKNLQVRRVGRR